MAADGTDDADQGWFMREATSPDLRRFKIEGTVAFVRSGPAFLAVPGAGRALSAVLGLINRPLIASQKAKAPTISTSCDIDVFENSAGEWRLVHDESVTSMDQGRTRADTLVAQIEAGVFKPNNAGG